MLIKSIKKEAHKIWSSFDQNINNAEMVLDIEVYKKWLDVFHVSNYYYYVFNIRDVVFDFMSDEMPALMGYSKEEYTVPLVLSLIHPDDQPYFLNFENKVVEFYTGLTPEQIPNYKVSYDYRIQKKDGSYIRVLQQVITIHFDKEGRLIRTLGVHTDISHLKPHGTPKLSFIGVNGEPSYYNVDVKELFKVSAFRITQREREILCLMVNGYSSADISERLNISKQTVDTHRKNIMKKSETNNTAELISKAIRENLI